MPRINHFCWTFCIILWPNTYSDDDIGLPWGGAADIIVNISENTLFINVNVFPFVIHFNVSSNGFNPNLLNAQQLCKEIDLINYF